MGPLHNLHKIYLNAYYLDLPYDLKFNSIFNILDLFPCQDMFESLSIHAGIHADYTTSSSMLVPVFSPPLSSSLDRIKHVIIDKIISTSHSEFQNVLVKQ